MGRSLSPAAAAAPPHKAKAQGCGGAAGEILIPLAVLRMHRNYMVMDRGEVRFLISSEIVAVRVSIFFA